MSFAFGVGTRPDFVGGLKVPHILTPKKRRGAAALWARMSAACDLLHRQAASVANRPSTVANGEGQVGDASKTVADLAFRNLVGLTEKERGALFGARRELSLVILVLETIGTALDLFRAPDMVVAWLRDENPDEPFNHRSPLQLMAIEGRLGVEIALLYLRARLRLTRDRAKKGLADFGATTLGSGDRLYYRAGEGHQSR